jgi:MoxR-like ATPase
MDDSDASRTRPGLAPAHGLPPDATAPVPTISAVDALGLTVAPSPAVAVLPDATRAELAMLASAVRSAPPRPMSPTMSGRISSAIVVDAAEVGKVIVGQEVMLERILIGLLTGGHVLLEGVPGLAKTLTVRTLCDAIHGKFARIQFTPDLLPADLVGTVIYNHQRGDFTSKLGPVFANLVLADEINRAPAKVQSALLEAMQERQVTIGDTSYPLPDPFIVMATQNPIEQEGTYRLPEAQIDRFMLMVKVGYPSRKEERVIIDRSEPARPKAGAGKRRGRSPTTCSTRARRTARSTWTSA